MQKSKNMDVLLNFQEIFLLRFGQLVPASLLSKYLVFVPVSFLKKKRKEKKRKKLLTSTSNAMPGLHFISSSVSYISLLRSVANSG